MGSTYCVFLFLFLVFITKWIDADVATDILRDHVTALRAHPLLRSAHIIFAPERNTGHEGDFLRREILNFPRLHVCYEYGPERGAGVWTTRDVKLKYGFTLKFIFDTKNVSIWEHFVCANRYQDAATRKAETIAKLKEQMGRYRIIYNETENPFGTNSTTLSGKTNKEGKITKNAKDDLVFSFSMATGILDCITMRMFPWFNYEALYRDQHAPGV